MKFKASLLCLMVLAVYNHSNAMFGKEKVLHGQDEGREWYTQKTRYSSTTAVKQDGTYIVLLKGKPGKNGQEWSTWLWRSLVSRYYFSRLKNLYNQQGKK